MEALEDIVDGEENIYEDVVDVFEDDVERYLDPEWVNPDYPAPMTPKNKTISKPLLKSF